MDVRMTALSLRDEETKMRWGKYGEESITIIMWLTVLGLIIFVGLVVGKVLGLVGS